MSKKVINAGIYIRVSSTQQARKGYSLETQEKTLKKYCEVMDWNVSDVYKDKGISSKRINHTELQGMFIDIKKGKMQNVVILKLDRTSRKTKNILDITHEINEFILEKISGFLCIILSKNKWRGDIHEFS